MYTEKDLQNAYKKYGLGGASASPSGAMLTQSDLTKAYKKYDINPQAAQAAKRDLPNYVISQDNIKASAPAFAMPKVQSQAQPTQWIPKPGAEKPRVEKGIESIAQTVVAAPVMFGETVAQATRDFAENIQNPDYRAALGKKIKGEILGETDQFGVVRGVSKETNDALKQASKSTPVSPDALGYQLMGAAKEKQAEAVEGLSPTGQFIGNTLISVGQNAALLPGAVINPALPLAGMGLIAAGDKSYELAQQGIGAGEAALRGTVSAGIETLTEMLPLENLLKIVNTPAGRGAIKTVLKQMGLEASEEAVSYVANYAADKAAADPNAKFSIAELAQAAASGAISGGILGGAGAALSNVKAPEAQAIENPANPQAIENVQGGNIVPYSEKEIANISSNKISLMQTAKDFIKFIGESLAGTGAEPKKKMYLGKIGNSLANQIYADTGIDLNGYNISLSNHEIRKIVNNSHGNADKEALRGQKPVTANDIENILQIVNSPDKIYKSPKTTNDGKPVVIFEKLIGDNYVYVQYVSDKHHNLEGQTMWITKKKSPQPALNDISPTTNTQGEQAQGFSVTSILPQQQNESNNNISQAAQNIPKPQALQDALYRLGERGYSVTQGEVDVTAGERSGAYEQRKMREYGVDNVDDLMAVMTPEDYAAYQERQAQDYDESIEALMYDIDRDEMARRARAAAKAPNEKTHELISNQDNGIIESNAINDSAQMLTNVSFAANKTISRVLDDAVRGAKGDLPLMPAQKQQLRQMLYNAIEKPLNEAKAAYIAGVKGKAGSFAKDMARLGIKAGSQESAAVQWIGEGQRQGPDGEMIEYTLADLQQQFPNSWQNIAEAAQICRSMYDAYVGEINDALKKVYPDVEKRAAELADKLNTRIAYNRNQAQIWLDKAAQLEQKAAGAAAETHSAESVAAAKAADRINRLNDQTARARETAERYTKAAEAARAKADNLQRMIDSGDILRNKRLMPRKDYFHHFNEMERGLGGFVNILTGSHDISAQLAGKSEFTKPKSKWWGALQQRTGGKYTADAVGGMARYIPAAEYKIAFDPFIAQMRGNVEQLVNVTEKTKNTNSLIEYLTDWTNDLAGKTNFLDRPFQKIFDRRSMKALEWLNNRAKANAVAGNIGSAVVQIGNIPNAMVFIGNPIHWAQAAQDIATGQSKEGQSVFLNERFLGKELDKLQKSSPLQDISDWMLEVGDRQAARLIWNAAYHQYESGDYKGMRQYESAADYADDITKRSIGGRGIGEMALTQKSRIVKLFAPFQVEVNNTWNLLTEKLGEKEAAGLMRYAMGAWVVNSIIYTMTGRRPLFDPIDALLDAIGGAAEDDEEDESTTAEKLAGAAQRIGGEVVSNMPYAATAATMLTGAENSANIFGEADPTRYGTGNIAVQSIAKPVGQLLSGQNVDFMPAITSFALPYGGKQAERTIEGAQALGMLPYVRYSTKEGFETGKNEFGASRAASGRIRFPITEPIDQLAALTMGEWSTSRGREYLDEKRTPLSEKQSEAMEKAFAAGISPDTYYDALIASKAAVSQKDAKGKTIPLSQDKDKVRLIKEAVPGLTGKEYKLLFEALGISKNAY